MTKRLAWLLPAAIAASHVATIEQQGENRIEYLLGSLAVTGATSALLPRLCRAGSRALPVWVLLLLFVFGYYLTFFWSLAAPQRLEDIHWDLPAVADSPGPMGVTFSLMVQCHVGLCLLAYLAIGLYARQEQHDAPISARAAERTCRRLSIAIPVLMVISGTSMYATGIAVAGVQSVYLPYRMAGIISHSRITLIPALIGLLAYAADLSARRRYAGYAMLLMLLHGASDMLLRGTRGSLATYFGLLLMVFLLSNRLTMRRAMPIVVFSLAMGLIWPVFSMYRVVRINEPATGIVQAFSSAVQRTIDGANSLGGAYQEGMEATARRVGGINSLMMIASRNPSAIGLGSALGAPGATRHYTVDILGYPSDATHGAAPSLLGWFWLALGRDGVVAGSLVFVASALIIWHLGARLRLRARPVSQALFCQWLAVVSLDGVLDGAPITLGTMVGAISACEALLRLG